MSAAQDAALSFLVAQHSTDQAAREVQSPTVSVSRNLVVVQAPAKPVPGPTLTLPVAGTLDAKGFIMAMRNAGQRRNDKGIAFTDPSKVRDDQIKAIAAFVGYDARQDFGTQESNARAKANRELSGKVDRGMTLAEKRSAERSMSGYVAGMPDAMQRRLADLRAREVATTEAMITHEKNARDMAQSDDDRLLSDGMAQVERERLKQIRKDIDAIVGR